MATTNSLRWFDHEFDTFLAASSFFVSFLFLSSSILFEYSRLNSLNIATRIFVRSSTKFFWCQVTWVRGAFNMLTENSFQLLGLFGSADYRCGNMYFESVIVHWNGWFWAHHCLSNEKLVCIQWQTQHVQSMPKHFSPKSTLPTPAFLSVVIFLLLALIPIAKWNRKKMLKI